MLSFKFNFKHDISIKIVSWYAYMLV